MSQSEGFALWNTDFREGKYPTPGQSQLLAGQQHGGQQKAVAGAAPDHRLTNKALSTLQIKHGSLSNLTRQEERYCLISLRSIASDCAGEKS